MEVIYAAGVNEAYRKGLALLRKYGQLQSSRAGDVLVYPIPVTTAYMRPYERVLFDPARDANPFFHFFEALWMLAGRNDAQWLDRFVKDFSARFSEPDGYQHGAYGYRWLHHFELEGGGHPMLPDQLSAIVTMLRNNHTERRAVLTMWDPVADLGADKRDLPCNTHVYFRVRQLVDNDFSESVLDITVCCRSNDAVWGAYGANVVHFSVLQEYMAARIGVGIGVYYQISNNFHVYTNVLDKLAIPVDPVSFRYPDTVPVVFDPETFDAELAAFFHWADYEGSPWELPSFRNPWFKTASVLYGAHWLWRNAQRHTAFKMLEGSDIAADWKQAALAWMKRRLK